MAAVLSSVGCGTGPRDHRSTQPEGFTHAGTLSIEHELTIGDESGTYFGRIADVVGGPDDRIFVADYDEKHIRVFNQDGDSLDTIGREGNGPGEFQMVLALFVTDSGLAAFDARHNRVSYFSLEEPFEPIHSVSLPTPKGRGRPLIQHADSSGFLARMHAPGRPEKNGITIWPETSRIISITPSGEVRADSLIVVKGRQTLTAEQGRGRSFMALPFAREPRFAIGPDRTIYHGRTDSLVIERYSPTGAQMETIRLPYDPIPVTEADIDSVLEGRSDQSKRWLRKVDLAETHPAFQDLIVDDRGKLWIDVTGNPDTPTSPWRIVDFKKTEVSAATLPANIRIRSIADGKIYGIQSGAKGVQEVAVLTYEQP